MNVRVRYFAIFREERGIADEEIDTSATTLGELYTELQAKYGFGLERRLVRAAVNSAFVEWSRPLVEGDEVALIPPVAGG